MSKIFWFLIIACSFGCSRGRYYLYSPDKKQSITIVTNGNIRYIIDGIRENIPSKNYVKIDLSGIDRRVGDEVAGCWNKNGYKWVILMDRVKVLENRLDTTKYMFKDSFPTRDLNIPTLIDFDRKKVGCFNIKFEYNTLLSLEGSIFK